MSAAIISIRDELFIHTTSGYAMKRGLELRIKKRGTKGSQQRAVLLCFAVVWSE